MKFSLLISVVCLWLVAAFAGEAVGQQPDAPSGATVVQMSYYAKPGQEQEVLRIRLAACDVLEKNGVTRGRVLTRGDSARATKNTEDADVVWEGEFPDAASLKRYEEIAEKNPDFIDKRQKMNAATRLTERRYYQLR